MISAGAASGGTVPGNSTFRIRARLALALAWATALRDAADDRSLDAQLPASGHPIESVEAAQVDTVGNVVDGAARDEGASLVRENGACCHDGVGLLEISVLRERDLVRVAPRPVEVAPVGGVRIERVEDKTRPGAFDPVAFDDVLDPPPEDAAVQAAQRRDVKCRREARDPMDDDPAVVVRRVAQTAEILTRQLV